MTINLEDIEYEHDHPSPAGTAAILQQIHNAVDEELDKKVILN